MQPLLLYEKNNETLNNTYENFIFVLEQLYGRVVNTIYENESFGEESF